MKQFFQTLPWKLARLEFYKKKPFAVTCTVIFSVLLAFDLAIAVFVPSTNSIGRMQGFSSSDMQEFMDSTEFDMSDLPGGAMRGDADFNSDSSSGSDTDSSFDSGSSSSGSDGDSSGSSDSSGNNSDSSSGSMPSGDMPDMPSGDDSGDMSGFPDGGSDSSSGSASVSDSTSSTEQSDARGSGIMGFLRGLKSHWILLAVLFGILDALSITRLVILARRAKKERIEEAKLAHEQMLAGEIVRQAAPAKKYKKTNPAAVWAIPMVGVLLLVAIVNGLSAGAAATVESTSASVYSGTAETTTLDTVVSGAGTLEEEDAESMELNSTVEISTWYVSNGDTVAEGDRLAAVDKVSVMSAIASLQEQLDELDAQLAEYETEEIDDTITAASDGRVMAIYAEEGTGVVDTMYDDGSLLLLSIDGYLAVDLETEEELQAGDSVTVFLSDDTEVTGKVGTYLDGTAVILVSDEDASLGEEVLVETEDGDEIGSGVLYIHSQLAVTGYLGTVDEISVEVGDEVESGDTLLTLTDTEYAGTYETLLEQRSELEEEMQELFTLYQDPYLYASCAGVVSGIDDDTSSDSSSSDDSDSSSTSVGAAVATATVCTVSSGSTSESTTATASTLTASSAASSTAVTTSTSDGYDNYIGIVQSVDDESATATIFFLTGVYEITDYSDLSDYDLSTDNMTESHTIDMSTGTIMFTYSSSGLTLGTAADIAAGDILVISYESGGSPGLGSTPIWIVRVVEDSSEDESGDTDSDSDTDSSTSGSDSESDSTDSRSDSSGTSGSSGSDSSSGSSSGSDTSGSSSSGSGSDSSGSSSGFDSSSGSSGSSSGSDSTSGSSGSSSGSDSASGNSGTASGSDTGNASGSSDYNTLESGMDSNTSGSLDSASGDSQGSTDSTDMDSFTGSTDGSESSDSTDTNIILDGTSSSTDLESLYSDSTSDSASSGTDVSSGSSSYSLDTSSATDSTLTDSTSDAAGETDASADGSYGSTGTTAYTVSKTTLLEITPQDSMTITITIDELDILSLEEGQTAQVTLDAFPGQAFEGEVTAIDLSGTNSGGSTKFTAEVTIAREDDMLAGMNASAVITIDTTENVLCIPENALVETDGVCYVYTTYDEKNEELGGQVEVTTGLSDGENVEILSGLGEGDSYYYSILDVVNYSTSSASSSGSSFSMESIFSSGGMGGR